MGNTKKQNVIVAFVFGLLMMALSAFAQTAPTPESSIADAIASILLIIAAGGAGYITIKLAHVGWVVGAKFIARLGGKA